MGPVGALFDSEGSRERCFEHVSHVSKPIQCRLPSVLPALGVVFRDDRERMAMPALSQCEPLDRLNRDEVIVRIVTENLGARPTKHLRESLRFIRSPCKGSGGATSAGCRSSRKARSASSDHARPGSAQCNSDVGTADSENAVSVDNQIKADAGAICVDDGTDRLQPFWVGKSVVVHVDSLSQPEPGEVGVKAGLQ